MKNLAELPSRASIFVDANLLVYLFIGEPDQAEPVSRFVERGAEQDIQIATSVSVVADVVHRIMLAEAIRTDSRARQNPVRYLKEHPALVRSLREHLTIPSQLHNQFDINILPVNHNDLHASRRFRTQYGLLTNDSLIVATMQRNKIIHLATNDHDFERVQEIQVWSP